MGGKVEQIYLKYFDAAKMRGKVGTLIRDESFTRANLVWLGSFLSFKLHFGGHFHKATWLNFLGKFTILHAYCYQADESHA